MTTFDWNNLRQHWGVLAWALVLGHVVALVVEPRLRRWHARWFPHAHTNVAPSSGLTSSCKPRLLMAALALVVAWAAWRVTRHDIGLAGLLAGWWGDPSTLGLACLLAAWWPERRIGTTAQAAPAPLPALSHWLPGLPLRFYLVLALTALCLWASVLWVAPLDALDPYRAGFHPGLLMTVPLMLWCWFLPLRLQVCVALAVLAWLLRLQASNNLWDYLVDVPFGLYATWQSVRQLYQLRPRHARPKSPSPALQPELNQATDSAS